MGDVSVFQSKNLSKGFNQKNAPEFIILLFPGFIVIFHLFSEIKYIYLYPIFYNELMVNDLASFEMEVKKNYDKYDMDFPRGSIKILDNSIVGILIKNAGKSRSVDYKSGDSVYTATFSTYTKLDSDGMVGVYSDVPEDENIREITFIVTGFHARWDTEVTFTKEYMPVTPDRELKHLINFQRAILLTGIIK